MGKKVGITTFLQLSVGVRIWFECRILERLWGQFFRRSPSGLLSGSSFFGRAGGVIFLVKLVKQQELWIFYDFQWLLVHDLGVDTISKQYFMHNFSRSPLETYQVDLVTLVGLVEPFFPHQTSKRVGITGYLWLWVGVSMRLGCGPRIRERFWTKLLRRSPDGPLSGWSIIPQKI